MTRPPYAHKFGEAGSSELRYRHRNRRRKLGAPSDFSLKLVRLAESLALY